MKTFSQEIPATQLVLNAHEAFRRRIGAANQAVFDAVKEVHAFDATLAAQVFDAKEELLGTLAGASKAYLSQLADAGIPVFSVRLATHDFRAAVDSEQSDEATFASLLKTFSNPIPIASLNGSSLPKNGRIRATEAMLDVHEAFRRVIEAANIAVYEAVQSLNEFNDPLAGAIFGANESLLQQLARTRRTRILPLMMTGVPIFSARIATPRFEHVLTQREDEDSTLQVLLRAFGEPSSIAPQA